MRIQIVTVGLVVVAGFGWAWAEEAERARSPTVRSNERSFSLWMGVKLEESQKIFASLVNADFAAIHKSASGLSTVNTLERFVRRNTPGYATQLQTFEFAVKEIRRQADKKNIEGVVLAFNQLTFSCVNCHKQLRIPHGYREQEPTQHPEENR